MKVDEFAAQLFGVSIDIEAKLRKNRKPDVLGSNPEVLMRAIGLNGGEDESIL